MQSWIEVWGGRIALVRTKTMGCKLRMNRLNLNREGGLPNAECSLPCLNKTADYLPWTRLCCSETSLLASIRVLRSVKSFVPVLCSRQWVASGSSPLLAMQSTVNASWPSQYKNRSASALDLLHLPTRYEYSSCVSFFFCTVATILEATNCHAMIASAAT
jgi:hypothetical protein